MTPWNDVKWWYMATGGLEGVSFWVLIIVRFGWTLASSWNNWICAADGSSLPAPGSIAVGVHGPGTTQELIRNWSGGHKDRNMRRCMGWVLDWETDAKRIVSSVDNRKNWCLTIKNQTKWRFMLDSIRWPANLDIRTSHTSSRRTRMRLCANDKNRSLDVGDTWGFSA